MAPLYIFSSTFFSFAFITFRSLIASLCIILYPEFFDNLFNFQACLKTPEIHGHPSISGVSSHFKKSVRSPRLNNSHAPLHSNGNDHHEHGDYESVQHRSKACFFHILKARIQPYGCQSSYHEEFAQLFGRT